MTAAPADDLASIRALAVAGQLDEALDAVGRLRATGAAGPDLGRLEARICIVKSSGQRPDAAEAYLRRATDADPESLAAWSDLAAILILLRREDEAETCIRRALALAPDFQPAHANLGNILRKAGRREEAKAAFAAAGDEAIGMRIGATLTLSAITESEAHIAEERESFALGLDQLRDDPRPMQYRGEALQLPWFYLAYHGRNDRDLLVRVGETLAAKVEGLAYVAPHVARWRGPAGRRIRIGLLSSYFRDHSVGRMFEALIRDLDRSRFEVVLIHAPHSLRDAITARIESVVDVVLNLSGDLQRQQADVEAVAADILLYTDIGMAAGTYFLAHARLAPVQAVVGGHPDTTGLATIDYYISSDTLEPVGAEDHYVERLVRLVQNPVVLDPREALAELPTREEVGLPATGRIYGCPHTLFKFHPQFDEVLAGIAAADPEGWIVVPAAEHTAWTRSLQARMQRRHPQMAERVVWMPRVSRNAFLAQLSHHDVVVDPLHFGCGNTLYMALERGVPVVTTPGAFARGRVVLASYRHMGLGDELVASDPDQLAALAVEIASDPSRRRVLGAQLREAAMTAMFSDANAGGSLVAFLEAAVEAAASGVHLPSGWRI